MRVLLALLLLSSAAAAQTNRLTVGERILMATAGVTAAMLVTPDDDLGWRTLASPAAAGLAVYGTGRVLGNPGRLGPTLLGSAAGALPALALFAVADRAPAEGFWWYVAGEAANVLVPSAGATLGFGRSRPVVAPTVLRGPDSERAAGLALSVGL